MIDRSALAVALAAADPPELLALAGELQGRAWARLAPTGNANGRDKPDVNLSAREAARRLGLSQDYLYRSKLPFKVRIGRRVLFSARGLERWNGSRTGRT